MEIFVFELTDAAAEALSRTEVPARNAEQHTEPMAAPRLRSLFECLGEVPECRRDRGKRYPLNTVLAIGRCPSGRLPRCEARSPSSPPCSPRSRSRQWVRSGARASSATPRPQSPPSTTSSPRCRPRPWTTPSVSGPPAQHGTCACRHGREGPPRCLEADRRRAPDDGRGGGTRLRHGPRAGGGRQQEQRNPGRTRALASSLEMLAGRIVTVDAMHAQHETARCLLGRRADYVISPSRTIRKPSSKGSTSATRPGETVDKGHGRIERRRCAPSTSPAPNGTATRTYGPPPGDRIEREREILKTGKSASK